MAVSSVTGYSAYWIGQIAKRYNTEGPAGMTNRRHTTSHRQPPIVPAALQEELRHAVAAAQARHEYWTGGEAAAWISARLGRPVSYHVGWRYLVRATPWPTRQSKTPSKKAEAARPGGRHRLSATLTVSRRRRH